MAHFDQWKRYLIVPQKGGAPVPHTRATTWASTLDDRYGLERWSRRTVALGLARRPDLVAQVAAARDDERDTLDGLCEAALEAGGSSTSANLGTALHRFAERVDLGEDVAMPEAWAADIGAYRHALTDAGITVEAVEGTCVIDALTIVGTFDRLVRWRDRRLVMDLKTGQTLDYSWPSIAVQLALYAHADRLYNIDTGEHSPMPEVDRTLGLVAHVPAGQGRCELIAVDLEAGWRGALLARDVRAWRNAPFRAEMPDGTATDDDTTTRRAWLVDRIKFLGSEYPDVVSLVARLWPSNVPTLKTNGHSVADLDAVYAVIVRCEARFRVPFSPEQYPSEQPETVRS